MQYFNDDQLREIAKRLISLTESEVAQWQQSKQDPQYRFIFRTPEFAFIIASRDLDDLAPHTLRVIDRTTTPARRLQELDTQFSEPDLAALIAHLYDQVKRRTLALDETADRVFKALDALEEQPKT